MHVMAVVADDRGRLGWNRVREKFADDGSGKKFSGPKLMSAMQDRFYEEVASRFGLQRGSNSGGDGSASKRQPIDREKGIQARIDEETAPLRGELVRLQQEIAREHGKRSAAVKRARNEAFEAGKREGLSRAAIREGQEVRAVTMERDQARANLDAVTMGRDEIRTDLDAVTKQRDEARKDARDWKDHSDAVTKQRDKARANLDGVTKQRDEARKNARDWCFVTASLVVLQRDQARANLDGVTGKQRDEARKNARDWKDHSDAVTKQRDDGGVPPGGGAGGRVRAEMRDRLNRPFTADAGEDVGAERPAGTHSGKSGRSHGRGRGDR